MTYLIWQITATPSLATQIQEATTAFRERVKEEPTTILAHETDIAALSLATTFPINLPPHGTVVRRGLFWVGGPAA